MSEVIKRRIKRAEELRDSASVQDLRTFDYFNGMVVQLEDLLAELTGRKYDERFAEKPKRFIRGPTS